MDDSEPAKNIDDIDRISFAFGPGYSIGLILLAITFLLKFVLPIEERRRSLLGKDATVFLSFGVFTGVSFLFQIWSLMCDEPRLEKRLEELQLQVIECAVRTTRICLTGLGMFIIASRWNETFAAGAIFCTVYIFHYGVSMLVLTILEMVFTQLQEFSHHRLEGWGFLIETGVVALAICSYIWPFLLNHIQGRDAPQEQNRLSGQDLTIDYLQQNYRNTMPMHLKVQVEYAYLWLHFFLVHLLVFSMVMHIVIATTQSGEIGWRHLMLDALLDPKYLLSRANQTLPLVIGACAVCARLDEIRQYRLKTHHPRNEESTLEAQDISTTSPYDSKEGMQEIK